MPPREWDRSERNLSRAVAGRVRIEAVLASLPPAERRVITLRDVERWSPAEVRDVLGLSEADQRALLHRARATVRHALDESLAGNERPSGVGAGGGPDRRSSHTGSKRARAATC